jgi:hypothetical protein
MEFYIDKHSSTPVANPIEKQVRLIREVIDPERMHIGEEVKAE